MLQFGATALRGSMYLLGTATGLALVIPLAAAAFTAHPAARQAPIVAIGAPAGTVMQSQLINRSSKGARLDMHVPSAPAGHNSSAPNTSVIVKIQPVVPTSRTATSEEVKPASASTAPAARAMPSLKGCLSGIGVTKSNLTTEELTICVADASIIKHIN